MAAADPGARSTQSGGEGEETNDGWVQPNTSTNRHTFTKIAENTEFEWHLNTDQWLGRNVIKNDGGGSRGERVGFLEQSHNLEDLFSGKWAGKGGMYVLAYLFDAGRHCFKSGNGSDLNFAVGVYDAGKGASVMPFGDQEVASIFEGGFRRFLRGRRNASCRRLE